MYRRAKTRTICCMQKYLNGFLQTTLLKDILKSSDGVALHCEYQSNHYKLIEGNIHGQVR
jgi:hypothetical protein